MQVFFCSYRDQIVEPAPVLKFGYLIVLPNVLWIMTTITSNPTTSNNLAFGQVIITLYKMQLPF
jgi:hypothetical protein